MANNEHTHNKIEDLARELEAKHGALFSRQTAATEMDLHPETVKRWCRKGRLKCVRLSERVVKIEARELAKLISESRI